MSFLKKDINNEESDNKEDLEEQYMRLFPKIGRDYATREDLNNFIVALLDLIDPLGLNPLSIDDTAARDLAHKYKKLIEKGKSGEQKRDLVEID